MIMSTYKTTIVMTCDSLQEILEDLKQQPEIQASLRTQNRIDLALAYLQEMQHNVQEFSKGFASLYQELSQLKIDDLHEDVTDHFKRIFVKYEWIYHAGGDAKLIDGVARAEGLNLIVRLKILRTLFHLSLQEAQSLIESFQETTRSET